MNQKQSGTMTTIRLTTTAVPDSPGFCRRRIGHDSVLAVRNTYAFQQNDQRKIIRSSFVSIPLC